MAMRLRDARTRPVVVPVRVALSKEVRVTARGSIEHMRRVRPHPIHCILDQRIRHCVNLSGNRIRTYEFNRIEPIPNNYYVQYWNTRFLRNT